MSGGDNSMIIEMIELFLKETPIHLDNLKTANEDQEWSKVASEAHKVKPIMLYVGLSDLNLLCKKLEDNAKSEQDQELSNELIQKLTEGYEEVNDDLEKKLKELK
jgi:HPt (histidine-containing phosphotransfer) domain-containing protein